MYYNVGIPTTIRIDLDDLERRPMERIRIGRASRRYHRDIAVATARRIFAGDRMYEAITRIVEGMAIVADHIVRRFHEVVEFVDEMLGTRAEIFT